MSKRREIIQISREGGRQAGCTQAHLPEGRTDVGAMRSRLDPALWIVTRIALDAQACRWRRSRTICRSRHVGASRGRGGSGAPTETFVRATGDLDFGLACASGAVSLTRDRHGHGGLHSPSPLVYHED